MIVPRNIKQGDTIGVTATSGGVSKEQDINRFQNGVRKLQERGYQVRMTDNVFRSDKGRSSDGPTRAAEFGQLVDQPDISCIIAAKGGDFLMEMLPYLDLEHIRKNPKWVQGYSDTTGLLYTITTKLDIATVYAANFGDFGMEEWHPAVSRNLQVLEGALKEQTSFDFYEDEIHDRLTGLEGYVNDKEVCWLNAMGEESIEMRGRLIGGCLDVLLDLIGTRYDGTLSYIEKYKDDGILWYLESFDINAEELVRALWHLKEAGWFQHAKGFVFGRPLFFSTYTDTSYREAVLTILGDMGVPIILDADIGHKGPQFAMINGAIATIRSENGKGTVIYE